MGAGGARVDKQGPLILTNFSLTAACRALRVCTVRVSAQPTIIFFSYQQVLKLGANEASAQGHQNAVENDCHNNCLIELWEFENRQVCI